MTEEKFREIYHQYYQLVIKVVYNVLHDKGFSEDICQEVFLAFLEKADSLEEQYYKQWILVNAKRKAIDFCRKSYQVHETTAAVPSQDENGLRTQSILWASDRKDTCKSAEDEVTHKMALNELTGRLFEDLEKKNSTWYEIVMKMNVEGESAEETARSLGISIENLRAKRHRIKVWINKYYREQFENL